MSLFEKNMLRRPFGAQTDQNRLCTTIYYSHLSNKRGGWNKRGGGAKNGK